MSENGQELKQVELPFSITVRDLADTLDASPIEIIKTLMANGMMANINQEIDFDTAAIVSSEMGYEAVSAQVEEEDEIDLNDLNWSTGLGLRLGLSHLPNQPILRIDVGWALGDQDGWAVTIGHEQQF